MEKNQKLENWKIQKVKEKNNLRRKTQKFKSSSSVKKIEIKN